MRELACVRSSTRRSDAERHGEVQRSLAHVRRWSSSEDAEDVASSTRRWRRGGQHPLGAGRRISAGRPHRTATSGAQGPRSIRIRTHPGAIAARVDPRPRRKPAGTGPVRVGDYRIIYTIETAPSRAASSATVRSRIRYIVYGVVCQATPVTRADPLRVGSDAVSGEELVLVTFAEIPVQTERRDRKVAQRSPTARSPKSTFPVH